MSYKEKPKDLDFIEDETLVERSCQKQTDVKRIKLESSHHETTLHSPTNCKTLRGFVKECRDNCLTQSELKQLGTVGNFSC